MGAAVKEKIKPATDIPWDRLADRMVRSSGRGVSRPTIAPLAANTTLNRRWLRRKPDTTMTAATASLPIRVNCRMNRGAIRGGPTRNQDRYLPPYRSVTF